jgi:hypothetical protein
MTVVRVGDWALARRILTGASLRVRHAINRAVLQEAQFLRSKITEGLVSQAPAGRPFRPLAQTTLAVRRFRRFNGTKALINRGDLRNSIAVHPRGFGQAFVGVLRTARNRQGKSLANVAELNEFGSRPIVIQITPKMRRFLAMALRNAGGGGGGGGGNRTGILVVQIPARPFIRPVVDQLYSNPSEVGARFSRRVATLLMGDFGGPPGVRHGRRASGAASGRGGRGGRGGGGGGILGSAISFVSRLFGGGGGGGGPERDPNTGRFRRRQ